MIVGTESYSQARMPESDHTDEDKDITNKDTDDVELAPLRSTDIIQYKAQDGHETGQ